MTPKLAKHEFQFHNWPGGEEAAEHFGLSHVVIVPPNARRVIVGGQVGIKEDGSIPTDLSDEIREALRHVHLGLKAAGLGHDAFEYIYSVKTFEVNEQGKAVSDTLVPIAKEYFKDTKPAWTGVEVKSLFHPALHLEITVEAFLPN